MTFPALVLALCAINWLAAGGFALAFPHENAALTELEIARVAAASDHRAVYGGLRLGIGGYLAWTLWHGEVRHGLTAAALLFAGLLVGRIASLAFDGAPGPSASALAFGEVVGLSLVLTALRREKPASVGGE